MIQWESCGDCYTSGVYSGHYAEACPASNGDWHVDIIRTLDGATVMHYDTDTMYAVRLTVGELFKRISPQNLAQIIDSPQKQEAR